MNNYLKTPFASLNEAMGGGFQKGRFSLMTGYTGFGKTAVACQISGGFAIEGHRGLYLSLDERTETLIPRFYSNFCSIPYSWIKDGMGALRDEDSIRKTEVLDRCIDKRLIFKGLHEDVLLKIILSEHLPEIVDGIEKAYFPLDFIMIDFLTTESSGWVSSMGNQRRESMMRDTGSFLSDFAKQRNLVVVATAQTSPSASSSKDVSPYYTAYCKRLAEKAQFCICMSSVRLAEDEIPLAGETEREATFKKEQNFSLHDGCGRLIKRIPILRELKYQRFVEANTDGGYMNRSRPASKECLNLT